MKAIGRFAAGAVTGFAVLRIFLGIAHGEPAPAPRAVPQMPVNRVAIPSKPPATVVKFKCIQMGMTPCPK